MDYGAYKFTGDSILTLKDIDPGSTGKYSKQECEVIIKLNTKAIVKLQEKLYAEHKQSLLVVFQAMDAGGKDSTIKAVMGDINPQGCIVSSFKKPSEEDLRHDFLWRIHKEVPRVGNIRVFNRSHYEDVLIGKVRKLASGDRIEDRYVHINNFESLLQSKGTKVVKIMLHISPEYQLGRFRERLENPDKHWKFSPNDLKERVLWPDYMDAFETAINRTASDDAPWHVIPAENKWYRYAVVSQIIRDTLENMEPSYPEPSFDPSELTPEYLDRPEFQIS